MARYALDTDAFVMEGYPHTRPFASFLPGIAGRWGIPMWAFYVNRGQAIAGFGIQDKDHPIMEFLPANRAYRTVPLAGFRTFLKLGTGSRRTLYEPFQTPAGPARGRPLQRLSIRPHDLTLEERHPGLGLETRVHYFTIPNESFGALARVVTLTNRSRRRLDLELLDGLPVMIPHGMREQFLKQMSRTIEAWVTVRDAERRTPFYQLKVEPDDRPEVVPILAGNFFVSFVEARGTTRLLEPIIDPAVIFGCHEDLTVPERFLEPSFHLPKRQIAADKTPCAMAHLRCALRPGQSATLYALFGHADSREQLASALPRIRSSAFFLRKAEENAQLIRQLTSPVATTSRLKAFDLYCQQTFLDNLLRGGTPTILGDADAPLESPRRKVFYIFCRKHGDLERDYNHFVIPATPFSQGNANYRDVNQNRRTDVWFHPEVGDHNIVTFFNLIQPDGFNPLVFKGIRCIAPADAQAIPELKEILSRPFTPGELLHHLAAHGIKTGEPVEAFLNRLLSRSETVEDADHGEGFWTDHWTYNLDLLESYLALYPERRRHVLLEKRVFTFYDNIFVVAPRAQKYQATKAGARQFHAVHRDREKAELIRARASHPHVVRTEHGRGAIYTTTLLVKMLCVAVNKLASLDPSGVGIEMEANKPNWCDSLNGLPGLFGSSSCETFELKRWLLFLQDALADLGGDPQDAVELPEELHRFAGQVREALQGEAMDYWERSAAAKETYREAVRLGFSGREELLRREELSGLLRDGLAKVERSLAQARDRSSGLYHSYFTHEVAGYTPSPQSPGRVTPTRWRRHDLPLFLEGQVHALRLERDPQRAKALHQAVRRSPLFDHPLQMYRICDSLAGESEEIGRCQVFNPGWLENQSVWLHMEYKYLLELLRSGLHEEFYQDFFRILIPFQPPKRYGRSILENSSFIVSSVYLDPSLHGNGFVARLSGATAEFLQMWLWMTAGRQPFTVNAKGAVELRLAPLLSERLFDAQGRFRCRLLGRVDVTYHNPLRRPTFGPRAVAPRTIRLTTRTGQRVEFSTGIVPAPYADWLRRGLVASLEVELAPRVGRPRRSRQPLQAKRSA